MLLRNRKRPGLERLEDRCVPAISALVQNGVLQVTGTAQGDVQIVRDSSTGTFDVIDTGAATPTVLDDAAGVTSIVVRLGANADNVTIDLGGSSQTLNGGVAAWLGQGANSLTVKNGTIAGHLAAFGGRDQDTVTLGPDLTVNRSTYVALGGGADSLSTSGTVQLKGHLTTHGVNTVTLDTGSSVGQSATFLGDSAGSLIDINGTVAKNVRFLAAYGRGTATNSLTVDGTVGGVQFFSSFWKSTGDTLKVNANVGKGGIRFHGSNAADTLTVAGGLTISGSIHAFTGGGNDVVTIGNGSTTTVKGHIYLALGFGADSLILGNLSVTGSKRAHGGPGTDSATGTTAGWKLVSFP